MKPEIGKLNDFCEINRSEYLIVNPTFLKGLFHSSIDLFLTNCKQSFMKSDVYETGISDHQKMIFSILRKTFAKGKPKTVFYRCYDQNYFNEALENKISKPDLSFEEFLEIFQSTLDAFAPYKQKMIRCNNNPFMPKCLKKEIMIRSKLCNKCNKSPTSANWQNYKKQSYKCVRARKNAKNNT